MPIRLLNPLLVNQIAAGEVIERPASVVKELVENAIDAGAGRIDVAIESGGRDLVRVADDGAGIPADELVLAVAPHATSKVAEAEDLEAIATMGFRGEALASIASVSRLSLLSRTATQDSGALIEIEGDRRSDPRPAASSQGTTVTVRTLFFNTPARRKFLRTDQTETSRCVAVVETLALAHPRTAFTLTVDGRPRLDLPASSQPVQRVLDVLGRELRDELLEVDCRQRGMAFWGQVGRPGIARGTGRRMHVFLNGRPINDRTVNHAIREAYRGLVAPDRFPVVALLMEMDPAQVDVNVHPAKAEVRFRQQSQVHEAVRSAVADVLRAADLVPEVELRRGSPGGAVGAALEAKSLDRAWREPAAAPARSGGGGPGRGDAGGEEMVEYLREIHPSSPTVRGFEYRTMREALAERAARADATAETLPASEPTTAPGLVLRNRYIVTADDEEGLVVIDQHALHERVMFELLKERLGGGALESQRLLMPATVEVDDAALEHLDGLRPLLERLGIEVEPIGPRSVAVHAFTSLLFERRVDPVQFMGELFDKAWKLEHDRDGEAALHEVLDMMACKAAVKSGDRLTPQELNDLLAARQRVERSSRCPHGRPTSLRLTIEDLDRQFGRS